MNVRRTFSGAPWEVEIGYCRALRAGNQIYVAGTAPVAEDGSVFAPGDAYRQTRHCIEIIGRALKELDATLADVVRTRLFVTDIERWREFGRGHRESFGEHPPTTSMLQIVRLIEPEMLIEIEAEAICG